MSISDVLLKLAIFFIVLSRFLVHCHPTAFTGGETNAELPYKPEDMPFVTTWPLKSGFPGLMISNLDDYLSQFPQCLTVVFNHQGIEMSEWKTPIYLFRFDVAVHGDETEYFPTVDIPFEKLQELSNLTDSSLSRFETTITWDVVDTKHVCYAQFDVYYPEKSDAFHFHLGKSVKYVSRKSFENNFHVFAEQGFRNQETFLFLVCLENSTLDLMANWISEMEEKTSNKNTQKRFILKTEALSAETTSMTIPQSVQIKSMEFVYPYCHEDAGLVLIQLSGEEWKADSNRFSYYECSVPILVDVEKKEDKTFLVPKSKHTLLEILKYPQGITADVELAGILFSNNSLIKGSIFDYRPLCDKTSRTLQNHNYPMKFYPSILKNTTAVRAGLYLMNDIVVMVSPYTTLDTFIFLCCGATDKEKLNFRAAFAAFDNTTSFLLIASLMIWPLFFSLLENKFNFRKVLSDIDGLVLGFVTILEQGHKRMNNSTGETSLYIVVACSLLVNIVVSNAFKGGNIQSAISKLKPIPLTHFDQLINKNFDIFTPQIVVGMNMDFGSVLGGFPTFPSLFKEVAEKLGHQVKPERLSIIEESLKIHPSGKFIFDFVDILKECNRTALVGWRRDLVQYQSDLRGLRNVFLGKEILFHNELGLRIEHWHEPRLLDRMRRIRDSGITDEWMNIANRTDALTPIYPEKVSLQGNIVVQFALLGIGLHLAALVFGFEKRTSILASLFKLYTYMLSHLRRTTKVIKITKKVHDTN